MMTNGDDEYKQIFRDNDETVETREFSRYLINALFQSALDWGNYSRFSSNGDCNILEYFSFFCILQ